MTVASATTSGSLSALDTMFAPSLAATPRAPRATLSASKMAKPILGVKPLGNVLPALPANLMSRKSKLAAVPDGVIIFPRYSPARVFKIPKRELVIPAARPLPTIPLNGTRILEPK